MPVSRASCSMISQCSSSVVEVAGGDGDEPGVGHLGVAGDELLLAVEQRLGGAAVAGVDAAALLLLGGGVGLELDEVAFDAASALVGRDRDEDDGHRAGDAAAGQERLEPGRRDGEAGPGADPPGAVERAVDAEVAPLGLDGERSGGGWVGRARAGRRAGRSTARRRGRTGSMRDRRRRWRPVGSSGSPAASPADRRPRSSASTDVTSARLQVVVGVAGAGAVTAEAVAGDGDGDDDVVGDRGRGADVDQLSVGRRARPRCASPRRPVVEPGEVLVHPRGSGEVGPGQVGDDAALDGELAEHVAPPGEQPLLLGAGLDDELRARSRGRPR